ncbi:uncharacterized protein BJ212DRAFT_1574749 [Suillus subaureus]|uniref:AGC-kinase C-terminal domain-containing protein n=1 Tax=Suillus subaureus TaxID=48587 RepID=A0A9P7EIU2_9AGAM|nr:uncharacterized protein BJ212DRAFT_1574749 [Suillus subaureus]KAG1822889.1 hypothetical protein BJ212DRAFT_1574749 [Suillus subaureus]
MYQKILADPLTFGSDIDTEARSILASLFNRDPSKRIGINGAEEIKKHPFFVNHIHFGRLLQKKIEPPLSRCIKSVAISPDVSNFDTVFTAKAPIDSYVAGSHLSSTVLSSLSFAGVSITTSL